MFDINPIEMHGEWDLGYSLDVHVLSSIPIGEDPFGHMQFDTTRSPIGEALFRLKYRSDINQLHPIVDTICAFLDSHPEMKDVGSIIPVPPTKIRSGYQPTYVIAEELGQRLGISYCPNVLINTSEIESKSLDLEDKHRLEGAFIQNRRATRRHCTLIVDDLVRSGTTLNQCVRALRSDPLIDKIFVLAITRTRN